MPIAKSAGVIRPAPSGRIPCIVARLEPQDRLRLAFSYAEKASRLLRDLNAGVSVATLAPKEAKDLRRSYARHLKSSSALIARERAFLGGAVNSLEKKKARLEHRRERLEARAASGRLAAEHANEEARRVRALSQTVNDELTEARECISAASSRDLGGMVDLPLDEYRSSLGLRGSVVPLSSPLYGIAVYLFGALAILGLMLLLRDHGPQTWGVEFRGTATAGGGFTVTCTNNERKPLILYLPWPESREETGDPGGAYGVDVYVREDDEGPLRLAPPLEEAWSVNGLPVMVMAPLVIDPGLTAEMTFVPRALENFGLRITSWKIVFSKMDGDVVYMVAGDVPEGLP